MSGTDFRKWRQDRTGVLFGSSEANRAGLLNATIVHPYGKEMFKAFLRDAASAEEALAQ